MNPKSYIEFNKDCKPLVKKGGFPANIGQLIPGRGTV